MASARVRNDPLSAQAAMRPNSRGAPCPIALARSGLQHSVKGARRARRADVSSTTVLVSKPVRRSISSAGYFRCHLTGMSEFSFPSPADRAPCFGSISVENFAPISNYHDAEIASASMAQADGLGTLSISKGRSGNRITRRRRQPRCGGDQPALRPMPIHHHDTGVASAVVWQRSMASVTNMTADIESER